MIGRLPTSLNINGIDYKIRTDYRDCLLIIQSFQDAELSTLESVSVLMQILFYDYDKIPEDDIQDAYEKALWFLDCGDTSKKESNQKPLYNFEQDEQIIFSAINKVAGKEVRAVDYMHFWTFMSYFNEIGESTFSTVVSIRDKKRKGKKLEKWEKDFCNNNKEMVNLKKTRTREEQEQYEELLKILGN